MPDPAVGEEADEVSAAARSQSLSPIPRRGAKISAGALLFTQLVTLVQTMALARILSPYEVGVFYAGTVLTTFLLTFSEGGLRSALVQRQRGFEEAANTVFWVTLWAGMLWAVLALVPAPLVGLIFGSSTAGRIAAATARSLVLHALTNVPEALLQRRFDFRQRIDRGRTVAFLRERSDSYQRTEVPRFSGCSSASRVCSRQAKKEDRCTPSSGVSAGIGRAAVRLFEMNIGSSKSLPSSSPAHRQHDE